MPQNRSQSNNTHQKIKFQNMYNLNIAFIFANPSLDLFGAPMTDCRFPYPLALNNLKTIIHKLYATSNELPVQHPWYCEKKGDKRNAFWRYYLGTDPVKGCPDISEEVTSNVANRCTKRFIPFYQSMSRQVQVTWPSEPSNSKNVVSFEGYIYRHGVSLVATANILGCNSIEELIHRSRQFRYNSIFSITTDANTTYSLSSLYRYLSAKLEALCGIKNSHECRMFSVAAFNVDNGDKLTLPIKTELQKALEAVTNWSSSWETDSLPEFSTRLITLKNQQNDDVLYATEKGRAIWMPRLFTSTAEKNYSLRWYYRNMVMSTMHIMSLCCFKGIAKESVSGNPVLRDYLDRLEEEIDLFETGSVKYYRSRSLKKFINDM